MQSTYEKKKSIESKQKLKEKKSKERDLVWFKFCPVGINVIRVVE